MMLHGWEPSNLVLLVGILVHAVVDLVAIWRGKQPLHKTEDYEQPNNPD